MFYVALRILLYDKVRSLITLLGVVFAVGLIFNQLGIFLGLVETASVIIDHTPGDIWITSKNSKNFDFGHPFPEYIYDQAMADPDIQSGEKIIVAWAIMRQKEGGSEQVEVVGFNPDTGIGGPWKMVEGDISRLKNGNYAIVDESTMKRLGKIKIGESREVLSRRVEIVGISRGVKSFTTAPIMFTSFEFAKTLVNYLGSDCTVYGVLKVKPNASVGQVVERLRNRLKGVDVFSSREYSMKTRRYWAIETGVGFSFLLTIVISFLVGMLIVGQTIYNSTMEHIKEFGTLKALGAENFDIYKIIFSQAMINAMLGYIVSIIVTITTVKLYEYAGLVMVVRMWVDFVVLGLTLIMCLSAAFVSIRRIKKIDPAILFRG